MRSCLSPSDKSVTRCHKKSANIEKPCDMGIYGGNKIFQILSRVHEVYLNTMGSSQSEIIETKARRGQGRGLPTY